MEKPAKKTITCIISIFLACFLFPADAFSNDAYDFESAWGKCVLPPVFYVPFYIGKIYPTPQQAEYHDKYIAADTVTILAGSDIAPDDPRIDILRTRLKYLGGASQVVSSLDSVTGGNTIIALGNTTIGSDIKAPEREQGYVIMPVEKNGGDAIILKGHDHQGLLWAIVSLNQLITRKNGNTVVRSAEVHDYPVIKLRGVRANNWHRQIWHDMQQADPSEHYAEFADHEEDDESMGDDTDDSTTPRIAVPDMEARAWYTINAKMNYTVFGDFHASSKNRGNWRQPPPQVYAEATRRTGELLSPLGIQWYAGYNPCPRKQIDDIRRQWGGGIDTAAEEDFQLILRDARSVAEAGGGFVLLFDDYRFGLLYEESRRFGTAREADRYFLTRLHTELREEFPGAKLLFCPPFYHGPRGGLGGHYGEGRPEYLHALRDIPCDIDIFWTGPRVAGTQVRRDDVKWILEMIERKPVFWQNLSSAAAIRRPRFYYPLDPEYWWQRVGYEGFFSDMKAYLPNCGMPAYALGAMTLSDYLWNPDAYDAERSAREAAMMMLGPDALPALTALRETLNYFNQYWVLGRVQDIDSAAFERAAAQIAEIRRMTKQAAAHWEEARKTSHELTRWTGIEGLATGRLENFPERLESGITPESRTIATAANASLENAVKETGIDPYVDVFLPGYAFSGGMSLMTRTTPDPMKQTENDEIFSLLAEHRPAVVWHAVSENKKSLSPLRGRYAIGQFIDHEKEYAMIMSGQERDIEGGPSKIKIAVNGKIVYEGETGFPHHDWGTLKVNIPGNILKVNHPGRPLDKEPAHSWWPAPGGILTIESDISPDSAPAFLLDYVVIKIK